MKTSIWIYLPELQYAAGLVEYVHQQLGMPIASAAPLAKISDWFTAAVQRFCDTSVGSRLTSSRARCGVPWGMISTSASGSGRTKSRRLDRSIRGEADIANATLP